MNEEDYLLRVRASEIINEAMNNFNTPGEQYLAAYVYLMHRSIQELNEKIQQEVFAQKKLNRVLNENLKLLKNLNSKFDEILEKQRNLEAYFKMIARKEVQGDE